MDKIKWAELADKDKIALILEHVMGCRQFEGHDAYIDAMWSTGERVVVPCPFAIWIGDVCSLYTHEDENAHDFDPLHSMDAAWPILLKMIERIDLSAGKAKGFNRHKEDALGYLFDGEDDTHYAVWGEIYPAFTLLDIVRTWTPERICIAALKATGLEIEL